MAGVEAGPKGLSFSQTSLADLDRCARRFYLRHLRRLDWPAPLTGDDSQWEAAMRRGQLFHLLVQQSSAGIGVEATVAALDDPQLIQWWRNYRRSVPALAAGAVSHSEVEIVAALASHRLIAKCDLVVCDGDGRVRIFDWKTGTRPPSPASQRQSWQTVVYRYAVVEGGAGLGPPGWEGRAIQPDQVELVYWHAGYPEATNAIPYDSGQHEEARQRLQAAAARVEALGTGEEAYARTEQVEACRRCPYRAYCERGRVPDPEFTWEDDQGEPPEWLQPPDADYP